MLQNLPYFMYKKTHVVFFVFHFVQLWVLPYECPGLCSNILKPSIILQNKSSNPFKPKSPNFKPVQPETGQTYAQILRNWTLNSSEPGSSTKKNYEPIRTLLNPELQTHNWDRPITTSIHAIMPGFWFAVGNRQMTLICHRTTACRRQLHIT